MPISSELLVRIVLIKKLGALSQDLAMDRFNAVITDANFFIAIQKILILNIVSLCK